MPLIVVAGTGGLDAMGMNKSGDQAVPAGSTELKVVNWTARAGYPNTVVTNNELIANGGGAVTVHWGASISGALPFMSTRRFQLMHNDTAIRTVDSELATPPLADTPLILAPGDRLWMRMTQPPTYPATVVGGVNTYLYFDLA